MVKAVVVGAAGGIGQPLSLLLKQSTLITDLALYDVVNALGVAADIAHINTPSIVTGYLPDKNGGLDKALEGADIVVIPAGVPRKPGMTRDDLFNVNAKICQGIAESIASVSPKAFVLVISNPVNSTVPIFAEVLKKKGVYDPKRLFGVTTLDVVRASTFVSEAAGKPAESLNWRVPVIGGHSGLTIVPLLSQSNPSTSFDQAKVEELTNRIQFGGDEVVKAKDGAGSATLSMAYAGARFAIAVLEAAVGKGSSSQPEYSYVDLTSDQSGAKAIIDVIGDQTAFFSVPVQLGKNGVEKILPIGKVNDYESGLIKKAVEDLAGNISKGVAFVGNAKI
ncbi:putative MDH1-malate dehydrogenase precursor, mitochondrial [Tilletiaria anomala UBC 951]|uniref:Malate dehydrogenase n=1 Tax=Tilletiaria anomala (strain ATCC 24038 / CBS 436.72 / UBC 951) TaxID=1037660 RepID=A0A066VL47_TILAU|nr:putative MDH1-malate dehydrogenase precursor, mitochondrial [Tilletiaria anomala UBC 951]KDN42206.1 putative MDH1-malate dehydrogenase precursor, mitochondrial [Tilletiaria anomala UBC 951]